MKRLFYMPFLLAFIVVGCGSGKLVKSQIALVANTKEAELFAYEKASGSKGSALRKASFRIGDKYLGAGLLTDAIGLQWYLLPVISDTVFVRRGDFLTEKMYTLQSQPLRFAVPKSKDSEVWSRASYFVTKYSDMKIQSQTDFLLQTYNPTEQYKIGFSITRQIRGEQVEFEVRVLGSSLFFVWIDKRCSYYMQNGEEIIPE